jgi:uncharacterized protein YyaL (SSP411 family)
MPNRLQNSPSAYLQQHAHNPVDWWPWCNEAWETAAAKGQWVVLSIGYSTCHWCHAMERDVFEKEEAALAMADYDRSTTTLKETFDVLSIKRF